MIGPEQLDINLLSNIFVRRDKLNHFLKELLKDPFLLRDVVSSESVLDAIRRFTEPEAFEAYTLLNFENMPNAGRTALQVQLQELISNCRILLNTIPTTNSREIGMITAAGNQELSLAIANSSINLVIGVRDELVNSSIVDLNKAKLKFLGKIFKEINQSMFNDDQRLINTLYTDYITYIKSINIGTNVGEIVESSWLRFYFAIDYALTALFRDATATYISEMLNRLKFEKAIFDAHVVTTESVIRSNKCVYSINEVNLNEYKQDISSIYTNFGLSNEFNPIDYTRCHSILLDKSAFVSLTRPSADLIKSNKKLRWVCGLYSPTINTIYTRTILPGDVLENRFSIVDGAIYNGKWYSEHSEALNDIMNCLNDQNMEFVDVRFIWNDENSVFMRSGWSMVVDEAIANTLPRDSLEFKLRFNCIAVIAANNLSYPFGINPNASISTDFTCPFTISQTDRIISGVSNIDNIYSFLSKFRTTNPDVSIYLFQLKDGFEAKVISGFVTGDMVLRVIAPNRANYINWNVRLIESQL